MHGLRVLEQKTEDVQWVSNNYSESFRHGIQKKEKGNSTPYFNFES